MANTIWLVCPVCGAMATRATRDIQQVPTDSQWAAYQPQGGWRFGCEQHPPEPARVYNLEGQDVSKRFEAKERLAAIKLGVDPDAL